VCVCLEQASQGEGEGEGEGASCQHVWAWGKAAASASTGSHYQQVMVVCVLMCFVQHAQAPRRLPGVHSVVGVQPCAVSALLY
jgi:hypothetical protein